ncbi:acetate--CoA ligase family protein, partial [Candidatus Roizmanbacteria bacterium]|nr:acetate--CoA ligase family protein [Candidatus Roizmanbacteria bacterium]
NAGGVGVLAADEAVRHNLILPPLSPAVQTTVVSGASTKKMTLHNPVDLLGDASAFDYQHALESLKQEKDIGAACVLLTPQANTEVDQTAFYIAKVQREVDFPIYPIFMGEYSVVKAHEFFEDNNIASFLTYDDLANCLSQTLWREQFVSRRHQEIHLSDVTIAIKSCEQEIRKIIQAGSYKPFLNLQDSTTILSMIAIPVVPLHLVSNENELQQKANELGYPLVMKIASDIITHKTEVRGVITAIKTYDELKTSYHEIVDTGKSRGVYLQPTAKGYEVFVGAKRDSHFGTVIVVGLGGIYAELLKDVSQRIYPFSREEYQEMIGETKLKKLFQGFRGSPPIDSQQLYSIVLHLGVFMEQFSAIKEIDINPLFVSSQQSVVADCRIIFV